MLRKNLAFFTLFFLFQNLCAQVLKPSDVLATADRDLRFSQNQRLQTLAQRLKMQDPLLRQVQFRLGINGNALGDTIYGYLRNEDTYQVQFRFNSLLERQRQRQTKYAEVAVIAAESRVMRQEALAERLEALAAYLFLEDKIEASRRLDSLLEKEYQLLREMLASDVFEVKISKVLDLEEDRNRNRLTLKSLENEQKLEKSKLSQFVGPFDRIERSGLADADALQAQFLTLKNQPPAHPVFALKSAEAEAEKTQLRLTDAENRQIFNHFQAGYQRPIYLEERPKRFNPANNISFRVGLTLPLPANNRFKKASAVLDLQEAQNDAEWTREKMQNDFDIQCARLEHLFAEHTLVREQWENGLVRKWLENPALQAQISPLERVEMEIAQQKLTFQQSDLSAEIAVEWVRLLDISGALSGMGGEAERFLLK
jgi:hypothetical protein